MKTFAALTVGQVFNFEGYRWTRIEAQGPWNARSGTRWGQFEDDEVVEPVSDAWSSTDTTRVTIRYT